MKVLDDTGPGELAIWARPDQQKVVAELLEQLKNNAASADKHTLTTYPIQAGSATNVLDMLKKLHPNLQVFPDAEGSRVFVWAHPTDQAAVKASLEQIQAPAPPEKQPRFEAYAIYGADPKAVVLQLQVLVPNAKLTYDAKTSRLVAFGTAAEHDLLKAAIAKLIRPGGTGVKGSPQLEVYPLTRGDGERSGHAAKRGAASPAHPGRRVETPDRHRGAGRPEGDQAGAGPDRVGQAGP